MDIYSSHKYYKEEIADRKVTTGLSILVVCVAIMVSLLSDTIGKYTPYIIIVLMGGGLFIDKILPIGVYIPVRMFNIQLGIIQYPVLIILMLTWLTAYMNKTTGSKLMVLIVVCLFVVVATFLGYNANMVTAIITLIAFFTYYCFSDISNVKRTKLIELALFGTGLAMLGSVLIQIANGTASFLWGERLAYEESVRTLANAIAFSIYFAFCKLTVMKDKKSSVITLLFFASVFAVGLYVLFMTYSRGVLLAIVLACAVTSFYTLRSGALKKVVGVLVMVVFALVCINSFEIDANLLSHNISSGNGRTQLWSYFIRDMVDGGLIRVIFGYGPGEFRRITQNTMFAGLYSHSVYMDALFSFGFVGFLFLIFQSLKTIRSAYKSKNAYVIGLSILTIVMYISHGISSSYHFYLMLGLCSALSVAKSQMVNTKSPTGV